MHGLRRTSVYALSVAVFSISACATSAKRLAEDVQTDGFTICILDDEEAATGPTVTVTDTESAERLAQWFCHRPRASGDQLTVILVTEILQDVLSPTIRIETTRLRVNLPMLVDLPVVLETRATPADEWNKALWKAREQDMELQRWAIERIKGSLISEYEAEASTDALRAGQMIPNQGTAADRKTFCAEPYNVNLPQS